MEKPMISRGIETPWGSKTYKRQTGCGSIYITVCFKDDGRVDHFLITGKKDCDCGSAFLNSKADDLTFMVRRIRNKYEAQQIIKNSKHHYCNRRVPNEHHTRSCVDAIGQILEEVLQVNEEEKEEVQIQENPQ